MFVEITSNSCSVSKNETDYISGIQRWGMNQSSCETQCSEYSWCRGVQVDGSAWEWLNSYRLLSRDQPEPIDGWTPKNFGNWVEPAHWKNGIGSNYKCYEKIITGMFSIQ